MSVRLLDRAEVWRGELLRDMAGSVSRLSSAALGDRSGGSIVTDPQDREGLTPARAVVQADVRLSADPGERFGGRAWVRFDHGYAPLAAQLARRAQQLFLEHFNPSE